METRAAVIGIGNADRGDDAAGLMVARAVKELGLPDLAVSEMQAEPYALMSAWQGVPVVYLADACASLGSPGAIHRFEAHETPLPERLGAVSSHGFGLGTTIELARALGDLPPRLVVFGIEAARVEPGSVITRHVADATRIVAERIFAELTEWPEQAR